MRKHGLGAGALIEASASRNPLWSRERHFFGFPKVLRRGDFISGESVVSGESVGVQWLSFASLASTPDL
jgi:hypothetical protein